MGIRQDWTTDDLKNFISGRLEKVDRVQLIQFLKANEEFRLKFKKMFLDEYAIKCLKYEAKNLAKSDFLEFKDFLKNNSL